MHTITKYVTLDGKEHASQNDAQKWLDKLYGDVLCKLGRDIAVLGYYIPTVHYLDNHLEQFVYLKAIKNDMAMQDDDDVEGE